MNILSNTEISRNFSCICVLGECRVLITLDDEFHGSGGQSKYALKKEHDFIEAHSNGYILVYKEQFRVFEPFLEGRNDAGH